MFGVTFLINVDSDVIKLLLGILIVAYSIYSLFFQPQPKTIHKAWAYISGFGTGYIGLAFSAGHPHYHLHYTDGLVKRLHKGHSYTPLNTWRFDMSVTAWNVLSS